MTSGELVPVPRVVTAEVVAQGDAWDLAVQAWLDSMRRQHTRKAYATDARQWREWCTVRGVDPFAARRVTVDTWMRHLEEQGRAPATVARKLSAVASLYTYLVREGVIEHSPAEHVQRPETSDSHSDTIALDEDQLAAFTAAAKADSQRVYVAVLLLSTLGIRSEELLTARAEGYGLDHGTPTLTIVRKRGKRQRLPMRRWVADEVERLLAGRTEGPIIANVAGGPMYYMWLRRTTRRVGRRSVGFPVNPHMLRASFATVNFDEKTPLAVTQDFMGHEDPRTTLKYDKGRGRLERLGQATAAVAKHVRPDADVLAEAPPPRP